MFSLGIYGIFKMLKNSKSVFVYCIHADANSKVIMRKLAQEKYFKTLPNSNSEIILMHYKKHSFGLDYEIHFYF